MNLNLKNYKGKKYNSFTVLNQFRNNKNRLTLLCRCDCGKEKEFIATKIIHNYIKNCGCRGLESPFIRDRYKERLIKQIATNYSRDAKKRKLDFNISKLQILNLISSDCFYCGSKETNLFKIHYKDRTCIFRYNGIDRLDNLKGYELGNCVSCCKECNYLKYTTGYEEFIEWIKKVYTNIIKKS